MKKRPTEVARTPREPDSGWLRKRAAAALRAAACRFETPTPANWRRRQEERALAMCYESPVDGLDALLSALAEEAVELTLMHGRREKKRDRRRERLILDAWRTGLVIREVRRRSWTTKGSRALVDAAADELARQIQEFPDLRREWGWDGSGSPRDLPRLVPRIEAAFSGKGWKAVLSELRREARNESALDAMVGRSPDPMPLLLRLSPAFAELAEMKFSSVVREGRRILERERRLADRLDSIVGRWTAAAKTDS